MRAWEDAVATALLGTERRPWLPSSAGALGDVLAGMEGRVPEAALLTSAALVAVYRRAGARFAVPAAATVEPSPVDPLPACSPRAAAHLGAILSGRYARLLPEWLGALAAGSRRVRHRDIPALLEAAQHQPSLRGAVVAACGERGRWLAAQNVGWSFGGGSDDAWETGSRDARRLRFASLRATDPASARSLLESTWATEASEDRVAFVSSIATGLSAGDEPFLERALDDRRREVRAGAAELLSSLPESRLAGRMARRAAPLVRAGNGRLVVRAPGACDEDMVRDGVEAKPPARTGERAWWLEQIVAATPVGRWSSLGAGPSDLVRMPVDAEWAEALGRGWVRATLRQRDASWARALLGMGAGDVVTVLPPDEHQRHVAARLPAELAGGDVTALLRCPPPWGPELSRAVLASLARTMQDHRGNDSWTLLSRVDDIACAIDPSLVTEAESTLGHQHPLWQRVATELLDVLRFRHEMRQELE